MAIKDRKITAWTSPVSNEADQPKRTAAEMKAVFDANSNQLKDAFNNAIDDLSGDGGTGEIGGAKFGEVDAGTLLQQLKALLALINGRPKSPDIKGIRIDSDGKIEVTLDGTTWQSTASSASNEITTNTYTTLSGILKGASNGVKVAEAGIDYAAADHTHTPASIGAASTQDIEDLTGYVDYLATRTPSDMGAQPKNLTFRYKSVQISEWASDTTYTNYPYRAAVECAAVTEGMFAEAVLAPDDATSGNFAPVCDTYTGGVYLYAKAVPDAELTIPTIVCMEVL